MFTIITNSWLSLTLFNSLVKFVINEFDYNQKNKKINCRQIQPFGWSFFSVVSVFYLNILCPKYFAKVSTVSFSSFVNLPTLITRSNAWGPGYDNWRQFQQHFTSSFSADICMTQTFEPKLQVHKRCLFDLRMEAARKTLVKLTLERILRWSLRCCCWIAWYRKDQGCQSLPRTVLEIYQFNSIKYVMSPVL